MGLGEVAGVETALRDAMGLVCGLGLGWRASVGDGTG